MGPIGPWVLTTHKSLHGINLHAMPKGPIPHLCFPNMGRKALGSLSINFVSSILGKILHSWDLSWPFTTIKAPSLLIPKAHKKSLTLTLLSSWWLFFHWLNLRRVFGQHPIGALCWFLVFLFLGHPIGALVDSQLNDNFCASSLFKYRYVLYWTHPIVS